MRSCLEISDLNCAVEDAETIFWGREFHMGIILDKKKNCCMLVLAIGTTSDCIYIVSQKSKMAASNANCFPKP